MLRIVENKSAAAAKKYYDSGLSRGDYYIVEDELIGGGASEWLGRAAERLGLAGQVTREQFLNLCDNEMPDGQGRLTARTRAVRRVGYDINFHVPKSVSVALLLFEQRELLEAFRAAVRDTILQLELDIRTRVRVNGANEQRVTGNLVAAMFVHGTTRPIDGIPDPHLHAHVFVFNATHDPVENKWKALDISEVKRDAPHYESYFHSRLAARIEQLGYETRSTGERTWELAHVPDSVIEKFSRRTQEIERIAQDRSITDPKEKAELGARTRRRKSESLPLAAIRENWERRLSDVERSALRDFQPLGPTRVRELDLDAAVEQALRNCLRYRSMTSERQVLRETVRLGAGPVTADSFQVALEQAGVQRLEVGGERFLTTAESQRDMSTILNVARDGRGRCTAYLEATSQRGEQSSRTGLQDDLMNSQDRVTLLRAQGRVFPTELEKQLATELRDQSHRVLFVSGDARGNQKSPAGQTVREFLDDYQSRQKCEGRTIWVRNPERVPVRDLADLCQTAVGAQARIVLAAGRARRGRSVPGDMLSALERLAGLRSAQRESARSTRDEQREAFHELKQAKQVYRADTFERADASYRVTKDEAIHKAAAREFVNALQDKKTPIIVTAGDVVDLTRETRVAMRKGGLLKRDRQFEKLTRLPFNDEQRRDARVYQRGQVVQFFRAAKGFRPGQKYEVLGHDMWGNVLARKGLFVEALPLKQSDRFSLFSRSSIDLGRGEFVRITCGGRTKNERFGMEKLLSKRQQAVRLANFAMFDIKPPDRRYRVPRDSVHRVAGFTLKGDIKLDNGWVLPRDFGHLEYGYCALGGQRSIGSFGRVLMVDLPSAGGRLPSLDGIVCERTPELRIVTPDAERVRAQFEREEPQHDGADEGRCDGFDHEWQRRREQEREAEYAREEYQHER